MDTTSSEDLSSSEVATDSSSEDESELLEAAKICGTTFQLPQGLCENKEIFKEFFSIANMSQVFEKNRNSLTNFLPKFPENDNYEKEKTLKMLFSGKNFKFGNPLLNFHDKLRAGNYRPDIQKMKTLMKILKRKDQKYQEKKFFENILTDLVLSRQKLLDMSYNLPPGMEARAGYEEVKPNPLIERTKKRYFHEISTINRMVGDISDFSDDENYPEGPPISKKQKITPKKSSDSKKTSEKIFSTFTNPKIDYNFENNYENTITDTNLAAVLREHKIRKATSKNKEQFDTKGITLKDIAMRTQIILKRSDRPVKVESKPKLENRPLKKPKIEKIEPKIEIKKNFSENSDLSDTDSFIEVQSPANSKFTNPQTFSPRNSNSLTNLSNAATKLKNQNQSCSGSGLVKVEIENNPSPTKISTIKPNLPILPIKFSDIKEEIVDETPPTISIPQDSTIQGFNGKLIPATLSDLEGIDMMNLPVDLDESNIDILDDIHIKPELMQDTHPCFFSLIRDIICSTMDHRMSLANLEERLKAWQENPISPLNDWYNLVENWTGLLLSALNFLCGESNEQPEDFVPYIEYKPLLQVYQWIGAGRDSDSLIMPLSQFWLEHRDDTVVQAPTEVEVDILDKEKPSTPPPPRFPTTWSVRKATPEEIVEFRRQEKERYSNPHKAYTYRMNGYESSVGPVKGIYGQSHSGGQKARGHSMLNADRPNYVTILTLVRDATARLPNGEGTRADICELLKSSQYISNSAPENVLQSVVSGALDRMHTEFDPCVKYDTKKKIWIYLHRNRTEADFERIHQQCQGMSKHLKKNSRKKTNKPAPKKGVSETPKTEPTEPKKTSFKTPVSRVFTVPTVQTIQTTSPTITEPSTVSPVIKKPPKLVVATKVNETADIEQVLPLTRVETQPKVLGLSSVSEGGISPQIGISAQMGTQIQTQNNQGTAQISGSHLGTHSGMGSPQNLGAQGPIKQNLVQVQPQGGGQISTAVNQNSGISLGSISSGTLVSGNTSGSLISVSVSQGSGNVVSSTQVVCSGTSGTGTPTILTSGPQKSLIKIINQKNPTQTQTVFIKQIDPKNKVLSTQNLVLGTQNRPKTLTQNLVVNKPILVQQDNIVKKIDLQSQANILQNLGAQSLNSHNLTEGSSQIIKSQNTVLTIGQQNKILETLKQKVAMSAQGNQGQGSVAVNQSLSTNSQSSANQAVLTVQQAILKQQGIQKVQIQGAKGQSLLGQQRIITQVASPKTITTQTTQSTPLVAKVLTNSAGQVISVESLLAHQKQHGTLPQGTTLRVSGKPGQPNLIQIASNSSGAVAQFAVVTQSGNQIKLQNNPNQKILTTVAPSQVNQLTQKSQQITMGVGSPNQKNQTQGQIQAQQAKTKIVSTKIGGNFVNAKIIQKNVQVQSKGPGGVKVSPKGVAGVKSIISGAGNQTVRMVNAGSLNLAHIGGKPVLFASKGGSIQNLAQNVLISTPNSTTSTSNLILQNRTELSNSTETQPNIIGSVNLTQGTTNLTTTSLASNQPKNFVAVSSVGQNTPIVLSQLKVASNSLTSSPIVVKPGVTHQSLTQNAVVLSGIKVNSQNSQNQRVVLASQGQGGQLVAQQILIPPNFQGGAINIKTLQGLKVIPLAQTQQTKGRPQQVFARIMSPTAATRVTQVSNIQNATQICENNQSQNTE